MFAQRSTHFKRMAMVQNQMRFFGVAAKLPKMELTVRTPYKTFFNKFATFDTVFVDGVKGRIALVNGMPAQIHLIPAGQLTVSDIGEGPGKQTESTSGKFIHTGGWVFVHP